MNRKITVYSIIISLLAAIVVPASEEPAESITLSERTIVPPSYVESVEVRPKRITIEYPDSETEDIVMSVLYERVTVRTQGTNDVTVVARRPERQVNLEWSKVTNMVPALVQARVQFGAVFRAIFTGTNAP